MREPRFLMAWNIQVSCNLLCTTRGIVTREIATRATHIVATCAKAMHEIRVGTNVQLANIRYSPAINLQNMLNSVHNCESHTRNVFINSRINYHGLIAHI